MIDISRRLPIGRQSFEALRQDGCLYVDKTKYIYELVHAGSQYFLSRPRRFGKSLFLSTLLAYWEGKKELFEGLDIVELEKNNPDAWQPHPVFQFVFNRSYFLLAHALEDVIEAHLNEWEKMYGCVKEAASFAIRFQKLLVHAVEKTGRKAVILIDEYDKPFLDTVTETEFRLHHKAALKDFYSALSCCGKYLQFVFVTGVTGLGEDNILSNFDHMQDISLDLSYNGICGVSEQEIMDNYLPEVQRLAEKRNMPEHDCVAKLAEMYGGYRFSDKEDAVYNPNSISNALGSREYNYYCQRTS